jgi:hypothetical protein
MISGDAFIRENVQDGIVDEFPIARDIGDATVLRSEIV